MSKLQLTYEEIMEETAAYIEQHVMDKIQLEELAVRYSYTPNYFTYMFGVYFQVTPKKYILNVKLKRASHDLLKKYRVKDVAEKYGFASVQSFSRAFHAEFQISPSEFINRGKKIKDIPLKREINHSMIRLEYQTTDPIIMGGYPVVPKDGNDTDLLEEVAYGFLHPTEYLLWEDVHDQIAMWWHDEQCNMFYLMGPVYQSVEQVPEGRTVVCIPKTKYAVFSTERKTDREDTAKTIKMLAKYIFKEWAVQNQKKMDKMGYTFERYKDDKVYLYIPLIEDEDCDKNKAKNKTYGIAEWTAYIDAHILENLNAGKLAKVFQYSTQHFRDVFRLYYAISVSDYIRKKKLNMAAQEIRQGYKLKDVAEKYGFETPAGFNKAFQREFHMSPTDYSKTQFEVVDLTAYYSRYKDTFKISFENIDEVKMIGKPIIHNKDKNMDIPAQAAYWFERDFPCLVGTRFASGDESAGTVSEVDKITIWHRVPGKKKIEYMLGPVIEDFTGVPDEMQQIVIAGGRYAVFETDRESDKDDLAETLRMAFRCVLYGWVKEYRERVDLNRVTFERYVNHKLYTYVPIIE